MFFVINSKTSLNNHYSQLSNTLLSLSSILICINSAKRILIGSSLVYWWQLIKGWETRSMNYL